MGLSVQKQMNRQKLLDQGIALLMRQGYHGTGLKEILDAVQVPKGSFYNYFGSKEHFVAEAIQHYLEPFIQQLENQLAIGENDAYQALQNYFHGLITELEQSNFEGGCLLGNLMGELGDTSEICHRSLQQAVTRYRDLLQTAIEKAQQQGSIRSDKPSEHLADLLLNSWQGALLRMKIEKSSDPLKQCSENILGEFFKVAC